MNSRDEVYDYVCKVILIGDMSVGKSNLLSRLISNEFNQSTKPTLGVEFGTKIIVSNGKKIKLQIWDTAGQEKYKSITNTYYVNSKGVLVVFDLTAHSTFENLDRWISEVKEKTSKDLSLILVGNKSDLSSTRKVTEEEIKKKAAQLNCEYVETSALSNHNVYESFQMLTDKIFVNYICEEEKEGDEEEQNFDEKSYDKIILDIGVEAGNKQKTGCGC